MTKNLLYYGDNLPILRDHVAAESVDLVYLDPPFKSNQDYNVLFQERDGSQAAAQIQAFEDTWHWDSAAIADYREVVEKGGKVSEVIQALRMILGGSDMLAYLTRMAPRLVQLRRVLKSTGSIYLHCDPTASHYLKLLLDAVFRPDNFRNEIVWKRTTSHGNVGQVFGSLTDCIFFYSVSSQYIWNQQYRPLSPEYIATKFVNKDDDGRIWRSVTLRNPSSRPNLFFPFTASNGMTYQPHPNGWSCNLERLQKYDRENRLHFPRKPGGQLQLKMYLDENPGIKLQNLWDDIPPINSQAQERLGYPTQKPEALLERIIRTSSNEGDTILDPFCGCGTAISVAQRLGRKWIGVDITHLAIGLIRTRLRDTFGSEVEKTYDVIGEPTTVSGAAALAEHDRYQFQWWALSLAEARPVPSEQKKGKDKGIDGRLYFHDESDDTKTKQVIFSVKSGHVKSGDVRDLRGVIEREQAAIGVFITLKDPSAEMMREAAEAGNYTCSWNGQKFPRLQIMTIAGLLAGERILMPPQSETVTFKKAPKAKKPKPEQKKLFGGGAG